MHSTGEVAKICIKLREATDKERRLYLLPELLNNQKEFENRKKFTRKTSITKLQHLFMFSFV